MTAGNSTPLTDGASAVLLASEEWAAERGLPVLAYFVDAQTAAVDHVHKGEGLLMAPAYAMPRMLDAQRAGLRRLRPVRDPRGVRRRRCWRRWRRGATRCSRASGSAATRRSARSTAAKLNVNGGSLAAGHPFAATGGRIVASLAKALRRARLRPRRDLDLRGRRPGRRRDPGEVAMSDRYSQLVRLPVAGTVAKRIGLPQPVELERGSVRGERPRAARRRRARGRGGGAGAGRAWASTRRPRSTIRCASTPPRPGSTPRCSTRRRRPTSTFKALVFDATGIASSADLVELQRFFYPTVAARAAVRARDRARRRAARAGGVHALARQGDRARRDRQPRPRRGGRRGADRPDAAVPALAALGVRVRAGRARRARARGAARRAHARSSPAPRAGSARRSPTCSSARARRSSGSTCKDADLELDITAADAPRAARRALRGRARHPRPQRGRDQGPHAGEDARGPLAVADGGQPARARADHGGAAAAAARRRADRLRLVAERDRRQRGPDELRDLQGRAARPRDATWSSSAGSRSTPSRPGFIETR